MNSTQKIKLLLFIPTLECGGTEKYISLFCNHINTDKFDATVVVLNNAYPFYEINYATKIIDLRVKRVSRAFFRIKKIIKEQQPDIIFSAANHLNLLFALSGRILTKKIPVIARESSIVSINNRRAKFPVIYNWLVKKFYRRLDFILCQSVYMQQDLIKNFNIPENKTTVIHNPVEELQLNNSALHTTTGKIVKFITVARLCAEKGIDRLIRSVANFSPPYQYFIFGEGDKRKELQQQINTMQLGDSIFLCGEKVNPWQNMGDADLFLSGSYYEGFPNAVLEAVALGIPVIAFDSPGGTKEIITNGENGLLVNDNDENAFTIAIENALQSKFDRAEIIASTKKRFSIQASMRATEELLINLVFGKTANQQSK